MIFARAFFTAFMALCLFMHLSPASAKDDMPSKSEILKMLQAGGKKKDIPKEDVDDVVRYDDAAISAMDVDGFHLHMTEQEAKDNAAEKGWTGGWNSELKGDREDYTQTFEQENKRITLFRYKTFDGQVKIYQIEFTRYYDDPQNGEVLAEKLIEKYGEPTTKSASATHASLQYLPNYHKSLSRTCMDISRMPDQKCIDYRARNVGSSTMRISVQPDQINIVLDGLKEAGKEQDKLEEHRKELKDAETKKNSEGKSLDF